MISEDRLVDIELKLTAQEDLLQALNEQVAVQQKEIAALRALCTALARRVGDMARDGGGADAYAEERPPHY